MRPRVATGTFPKSDAINVCPDTPLRIAFADAPKESSYTITRIPGPKDALLEVGGMDWMPDGRLAVCTRRGEVWTLDTKGQWKLFATGLQEALGVTHGDGANDLYVMQRPELTHLIDTKHAGVADRYETVNMSFCFSGNYHEFAYGPAVDRDGYVYYSLNLARNPDAFGAAEASAQRAKKFSRQVCSGGKGNRCQAARAADHRDLDR